MKYSIIGGGIAGLATALAFEKNNIEYQVFERAHELTEVGAGIWLAPNALKILEYLGLLEEVRNKGNTINRITLGKADLTPLSDTFRNTIERNFGYSTIAIHRAELQKLLFNKIPKHKVYLGKSFESFEELSNKKIKIKFSDKSNIETDYLISADGIHSKVRKQLFSTSKIRYSGQTCWRGISNTELPIDFKNRGIELWSNQLRFGFSKISKSKVYWFAVSLDKFNQKENHSKVLEKLLDMFNNFHSMVNQLISNTPKDKIHRNDIIDLQPLEKWYKDNICLIGDAGHATTPNMGQGGAQAIEDAHYLSYLIKNNPNQNIFELFQKKRQKKVNSIVKQSWKTGKIAHWKYGASIRNFILKNITKTLMERKVLEMYQIKNIEGIGKSQE